MISCLCLAFLAGFMLGQISVSHYYGEVHLATSI